MNTSHRTQATNALAVPKHPPNLDDQDIQIFRTTPEEDLTTAWSLLPIWGNVGFSGGGLAVCHNGRKLCRCWDTQPLLLSLRQALRVSRGARSALLGEASIKAGG